MFYWFSSDFITNSQHILVVCFLISPAFMQIFYWCFTDSQLFSWHIFNIFIIIVCWFYDVQLIFTDFQKISYCFFCCFLYDSQLILHLYFNMFNIFSADSLLIVNWYLLILNWFSSDFLLMFIDIQLILNDIHQIFFYWFSTDYILVFFPDSQYIQCWLFTDFNWFSTDSLRILTDSQLILTDVHNIPYLFFTDFLLILNWLFWFSTDSWLIL